MDLEAIFILVAAFGGGSRLLFSCAFLAFECWGGLVFHL